MFSFKGKFIAVLFEGVSKKLKDIYIYIKFYIMVAEIGKDYKVFFMIGVF